MSGIVLDAGAFLALERRVPGVVDLFDGARERKLPLITSAGVIGQVWRGGARQAAIAMALKWSNTTVEDLTEAVGRTVGRMLAGAGSTDVIDAHVVLLAKERGWPVLTSDVDDLSKLDPTLTLWRV